MTHEFRRRMAGIQKKRTQNNDSEDDPRVQKKNGGNTEKVQQVFIEHPEEIKRKQADKQYLERKIH